MNQSYIPMSAGRFLLFIFAIVLLSVQGNAQGTWTPLNNAAPDYNSGVMILLTDGTVLCKTSTGDTGSLGNTWDKLTPDSHGSYINGTWSTETIMHDYRLYFSCQVLTNGQLYIAGGEYGGGGTKSEVYNPQTNVWTECPQIVTQNNISDANSELLPDGTVLQAVVDTGDTKLNYIYYPATNTYSTTASCLRVDNEAMWVKQPDNSVIFIDNYGTTSERYIPATHTWINDATVPDDLYDPYGEEAGAAFLLPNGKSWFIGSTPTSAYYTPSGSTSPGAWAAGPVLPSLQGAPDAASAMMVNGKILLSLSPTPTSPDHFPDSTTFYEFDYTTNTYTMVSAPGSVSDTLGIPTYYTNMLCLPDGTILYCAQGDDQYYEYKPGSAALAAGKPTINNIIRTNCNTYTITGTLFNGITEGAGYGDDWQMSTNYPIVQLSSGANVYYARTTNWNRPGAVMTGAALDTATFTLPTGLPYGTYAVKVIVNGNPSAASSINTNPVAITPASSTVCSRFQATFADALTGGVWSTASSAIATAGTSGVVTGVAAGVTAVSYTIGTCVSVATVSVNASPAVITPSTPTSLCLGSTANLGDATPSGTWSSSSAAVATISAGGLLSSVSTGTTVVSYTVANGCFATDTTTVSSSPFGISGSLAACVGSTTNLSDPTSGGTWSSGNTAVATIGVSGIASGVMAGSSVISYILPTGCYTSSVLNVSTAPTAISGITTLCQGSGTNLSDGAPGGTWSSGNIAVAAIIPATGAVSTIGAGTAIITYSVASGCTATTTVTVNTAPGAISGATALCETATAILSDGTTGGTWTSSNAAAATIDISTGMTTGVGAGTSVISYTLGDGCAVTAPLAVSLAPAAIAGASSVCDGASTILTDPSSGGAWSSSDPTISIAAGTGLVTGLSFGTAMVTYTLDGTCTTTSVITVNNSPGAISGSDVLCVGLTTSFTDPALGGAWSSSATATATVSAGIVTGVVAGVATISYDLGSGCIATTVVTVNPLPTIISGAMSLCATATSALSDGVSGGAWSSSNIAVAAVNPASGIVTGITTGSATITYTLGAGCVATAHVTIISSPTAITGATIICSAGTTALGDGTPGGTWTSSNASIATISLSSGIATGVAPGTAIITYSLGSGCSTTTALSVTPPTSAPVTGVATVCAGQTGTLADATSGGLWTSADGAIATVNTSGVVTGVSAGAVTISYTVVTACGTAYASKNITINAVPSVAAVTGTPTMCIGATTALSDATSAGVWSSSNTAVATVASTTGIATGVSAGPVLISYSVTNSSGCTTSSEMTVTVTTPLSAIIIPLGATSFCRGGSVLLNATPGIGLTYQWLFNGSSILGATSSTYTAGSSSGGVYTVKVNSGSACISLSSPLTVTVDTSAPMVSPIVNVSADPGNVLCLVTSPVTFTASSIYGGTPSYKWYVNGTAMTTGTTFSYSPANGDVVKTVLTSTYACASPDTAVTHLTMTISPDETPSVTVSATPGTTICSGQAVTFTPSPAYGGAAPGYLWSKNGVNIITAPTFSYTPANGDVVKCTLTSDYACLSSATAVSAPVTLHVNPSEVNSVTISVSQATIGAGQVDTFKAIALNGGTSPIYQWFINGSPVPGATSPVYITSSLANSDLVTCDVTSSNPCADPNVGVSGGITVHVGATGVTTISNATGFALEPNPNKGVFTVTGTINSSVNTQVFIKVTDMLGQAVYQGEILPNNGNINQRIQLPDAIANGVYLVNITSGGGQAVFHIVVTK